MESHLPISTAQCVARRKNLLLGAAVIGPDGSPLTIADLPPETTRRWVIRRKAEVVAAVRGGLLSMEEACERYKLTVDEFLSWQRSIDKHGLAEIAEIFGRGVKIEVGDMLPSERYAELLKRVPPVWDKAMINSFQNGLNCGWNLLESVSHLTGK